MATHSGVLAWRIPGTGKPWWAAIYGVAQSQTQLKQLNSNSSKPPKKEVSVNGEFCSKGYLHAFASLAHQNFVLN